jgi:hypothetical protein
LRAAPRFVDTAAVEWLRPKRPRLAEATAIAAERPSEEPSALWRRFIDRGLISAETRRRFAHAGEWIDCAVCGGSGYGQFDDCRACGGGKSVRPSVLRDAPATREACVALAADGSAIAEVEALALAVVPGLSRWNQQGPSVTCPIVWMFPPQTFYSPTGADYAKLFDDLVRVNAFGLALYEKSTEAFGPAATEYARHVGDPAILRMQATKREGLGEVALETVTTSVLYGWLKPALPDVFPTLFRIFELGYALSGITDERIELLAQIPE